MIGPAELVAGRARQLGAPEVHLIGQVGHVIVLLRNRGRAKGIGLDQIGAGCQVFLMDVANHVGTGQRQQLVVALDVMGEVLEALARSIGTGIALAAILRLAQLETLNHGAHGSVKNDEALGKRCGQLLGSGVGGGGVRLAHRPPL
ncbi:hypothetical protein SDC9_159453 [bioreactor metagenome]|uniref:Uncharacterized protein n=1 Tax=bioreactor metagenome TaxID=1076179 RepID=A0A645FCS3_9ZZZZ